MRGRIDLGYGVKFQILVVLKHVNMETEFNAIANEKAQALIALKSSINLNHRKLNADLAAKRRLLIEEMGVDLDGAEVALHLR
jgi:hypothetical protein